MLVKRWLSLMLLVGALFGLLGQEVAFASVSAISTTDAAVTSSAMGDECAEMMAAEKSQKDEPCKGLTLDCIAKMGCAIPLSVVTPDALPAPAEYRPARAENNPVARLVGRTFGPEPEPPLYLG